MSIFFLVLIIIAPFVSVPLIFFGAIYEGKKHPIIYSILLSVPFALLAYNYIPDVSKDLYRYYVEMKYIYEGMDLTGYFGVMFGNTKILFNTIQFIFTKIGNYNLLPVTITFIGYSISFYMILDYMKICNCKRKYVALMLILFICVFYHINFISGLAQYFAISMSFLAFYLEYVKKKKGKIYKILYILPCLIHITMVMALFFRIIMSFKFEKIKNIYLIILIIYLIIPNVFLIFVNDDYLLGEKIKTYMVNGDRLLSSTYEIAMAVLFFIIFIFFIKTKKKVLDITSDKFIDLGYIFMLFNLFSIRYEDIFLRFFNYSFLYMILYLAIYLEKVETKNKKYIVSFILLICIIFGSVNINNFKAMEFKKDFLIRNMFYIMEK